MTSREIPYRVLKIDSHLWLSTHYSDALKIHKYIISTVWDNRNAIIAIISIGFIALKNRHHFCILTNSDAVRHIAIIIGRFQWLVRVAGAPREGPRQSGPIAKPNTWRFLPRPIRYKCRMITKRVAGDRYDLRTRLRTKSVQQRKS